MKTIVLFGVLFLTACQGCGAGTPTPTGVSVSSTDAGIVTCVTIKPVLGPDGSVIGSAIVTQ